MIATNALVTWDNLSVMGLTPKSGVTAPTGLRIVTKGGANTYYWINNTVSPFSTYTNLRCPRYQDIVPLSVSFRSYRVDTAGYSGTWTYTDCYGNPQSQYMPGSPPGTYFIFPCVLVDSLSFSGVSAYSLTGMPCDCGSTACESYTLVANVSANLFFVDCSGIMQTVYVNSGNTLNFCAQKGQTWWGGTGSYGQITDNGACTIPPPPICNTWETYDPAYFEYIDCYGTYQYQYLDYGSTICVQNGYFVTGPIYNTGIFC